MNKDDFISEKKESYSMFLGRLFYDELSPVIREFSQLCEDDQMLYILATDDRSKISICQYYCKFPELTERYLNELMEDGFFEAKANFISRTIIQDHIVKLIQPSNKKSRHHDHILEKA